MHKYVNYKNWNPCINTKGLSKCYLQLISLSSCLPFNAILIIQGMNSSCKYVEYKNWIPCINTKGPSKCYLQLISLSSCFPFYAISITQGMNSSCNILFGFYYFLSTLISSKGYFTSYLFGILDGEHLHFWNWYV